MLFDAFEELQSFSFLEGSCASEAAVGASVVDSHELPKIGACDPHGHPWKRDWTDDLLSDLMSGRQSFELDWVDTRDDLASVIARLIADNDTFVLPADGPAGGRDNESAITYNQNTGPEIIVIGTRISLPGGGYGGGSLDPKDPDASIDDPGEEGAEQPAPDCMETTATAGFGVTLDEDERDNLETIGDAANDLIEAIGALPDGGKFVSSTGEVIYVGELFSLLMLADWRISNQSFNNAPDASMSTGAAVRNGGNPIFFLSEMGLAGHGADSFSATAYILHEPAHVTVAGDARHSAAHADGSMSESEWLKNEQWANALAAAVASAVGQPLSNWPGLGDDVGFGSVTFTYVPPSGSNLPTVGEAYEGCGGTA